MLPPEGEDTMRLGETEDERQASEEGLAYVPPIDPPTIGGDAEGPAFASGFGLPATDEPFDADHNQELLSEEPDLSARLRDALRADAATSRWADQLGLASDGRAVVVEGEVDDLDDEEEILAVLARVAGSARVVNRIAIRNM
jgi:hypothetical protein